MTDPERKFKIDETVFIDSTMFAKISDTLPGNRYCVTFGRPGAEQTVIVDEARLSHREVAPTPNPTPKAKK